MGPRAASGVAHSGEGGPRSARRLGTDVRPSRLLRRNLHRSRTLSRPLLPCGKLATPGIDYRARQERADEQAEPPDQRSSRFALDAAFPRVPEPVTTMRQRVEVNLEELDQIIDRSTRAPLSESE